MKPGVYILMGAIVAMGAVIKKAVPKCTINSGNPACVPKYRDIQNYYCLHDLQQYDGINYVPMNRPASI